MEVVAIAAHRGVWTSAGRAAPGGAVVEPLGYKNQAASNSGKGYTEARGGARAGKPKCVRIFAITWGSTMAVMIFKRPPQQEQRSMSNTRLSRQAQLMRRGAEVAGLWAS